MDFSDDINDEVLNIFQTESDEIISRINNNLLTLEKKPCDQETILLLFRDAHSLKGASRMVGFDTVQAVAHKIEDVLGFAKDGEIVLKTEHINILFNAVDFIAEIIQKSIQKKQDVYSEKLSEHIAFLEGIQGKKAVVDEIPDDVQNLGENIDWNAELANNQDFNIESEASGKHEIKPEDFSTPDSLSASEPTKKEKPDTSSSELDLDFLLGNKPDTNSNKDRASATSDTSINATLFKENVQNFNTMIIEALTILIDIETNEKSDGLSKLLKVIKDLYEIFKDVGIYEVKKALEDIKFKLEFTINGSNSLTILETEEMQQKVDSIINKLTYFFELYNIELVDYYSHAFETISSTIADDSQKEIRQVAEIEAQVDDYEDEADNVMSHMDMDYEDTPTEMLDLDFIQYKIDELSRKKISIKELNNLFEKYKSKCKYKNVNAILSKIVNIFKFVSANELVLNDEALSIIKQTVDYCNNSIKNKKENIDIELVSQQLEIVQQILEIEKQKTNVKVFINPKEEKTKNITDFSEAFGSDSIKTLRVDSTKLDSLINQMNELTIEKIKSKKRLIELDLIIKDIEDNQKNIIKYINYLKYLGKKQNQGSSESIFASSFMKQFITSLIEDNKRFQKITHDTKFFYKSLQEDDVRMDDIINSLGNMIKDTRILPFATVFHLFGRMVRDIAQEKGKKINLEIIGSETCTDKKIIEEIKTPLIHIIRNSIDHGIETPEERQKIGKTPAGQILLSAKQKNNKVIVEISDDGRGINVAKVKEKALSKGFLTESEVNSMTNEQLTNLVFMPGFSTGDEITNISGRGIGLDVVQSKIMQLNGKVRLISELNKGCCVQIELPSTMLLMKVLITKINNQNFAIPIEYVNTVLLKKSSEIIFNNNNKTIIFDNSTIPLVSLSDVLHLKNNYLSDKMTIIIVETDKNKVAICVDEITGEQEILHKNLLPPLYKVKNIFGITTLISGETCLILNIAEIIKNNTNINVNAKTIAKPKPKKTFSILVVDDSKTTRTLEKNILNKIGYNVISAENPIDAMDKMRDTVVDLIILDMEMPKMTGLEFLEQLKSDEMYNEIPVIIISSCKNEDYQKKAKKLGAVKYIIKNEFDQEMFEKTINDILHKRLS